VLQELKKHADANGYLAVSNLRDALKSLFERFGIPHKGDEVALLAHKFLPSGPKESGPDSTADVHVNDIVNYCKEESDRQEWSVITKNLRACATKAAIVGVDIEHLLSKYDGNGDGFISVAQFKEFLTEEISPHGKLTSQDINTISRRFAEPHKQRTHTHGSRDTISLPEVMHFFGKPYVGNLEARLKQCIKKAVATIHGITGQSSNEQVSMSVDESSAASGLDARLCAALNSMLLQSPVHSNNSNAITLEELENLFRTCKVYEELSHEQVQKIIHTTLDPTNRRSVFIPQFLKFVFDGRHFGAEQSGKGKHQKAVKEPELDAEGLLRLLLDRVKKLVNVDQVRNTTIFLFVHPSLFRIFGVIQAFRHFDTDGNGAISPQELEKGLDDLGIFDNIDNWKAQLPTIVRKFDSTGDGSVQLRVQSSFNVSRIGTFWFISHVHACEQEFFKFLGDDNYTPNIIQTMTRVFALAVEQPNTSLEDIFVAIDASRNGEINADELRSGLKTLNLYNDISIEDCREVVQVFDKNGDGQISKNEFVEFFSGRIKQATKDRRQKRANLVANKFRGLMQIAIGKGVFMTLRLLYCFFE
jgi:Ca2+-binding EF-hand superfamily protein